MGRTTEDRKGHTIILRVNEGLYGELKRYSEREEKTLSEYTREILTDKFCGTKPVLQKLMSEETQRDIESMCHLSGLSMQKFFDSIDELFNEGYIFVEGLTVKTKGKYDLRRLEDLCHRNNLDVQDVLDKVVNRLIKG